MQEHAVYRILDANLNRLREALRVVEECFRFIVTNEPASIAVKQLRHTCKTMENALGAELLLTCRDTSTDCFADENRPEEMTRSSVLDILRANFKRAEEAARAIEEFSKLSAAPAVSSDAKRVRFTLYQLEQRYCRNDADG